MEIQGYVMFKVYYNGKVINTVKYFQLGLKHVLSECFKYVTMNVRRYFNWGIMDIAVKIS